MLEAIEEFFNNSAYANFSTITGLSIIPISLFIYQMVTKKKERREKLKQILRERKEKLKCALYELNVLKGMSKDVRYELNNGNDLTAKRISRYMVDVCQYISGIEGLPIPDHEIQKVRGLSVQLRKQVSLRAAQKISSVRVIRESLENIQDLTAKYYSIINNHL